MKGYRKYFLNKLGWFLVTLRLRLHPEFYPAPPDARRSRNGHGTPAGSGHERCDRCPGDLSAVRGPVRYQQTPVRTVFSLCEKCRAGRFRLLLQPVPQNGHGSVIASSIWWTMLLQLPAILVGWVIGNLLGALAAYRKKGFDKVLMPVSIFVSSLPAFGMAVILLVVFALTLGWFPTSGGYGFDRIPNLSWKFLGSVFVHYQLPFWSIVLITIGGQAIGMRSMSIYELNADYVKFSRFMGIKDRKIVGYVFAMPCFHR